MSERFNSPPEAAPPAPNPAELDARMEVLRKKHAVYETLIRSHNPSQDTLARAKIMLEEIRAELDSIKEAMNPDKFEIKLRERLAAEGNFMYVGAFTKSGLAVAHHPKYTQILPDKKMRNACLINRRGDIVHSSLAVHKNAAFQNGLLEFYKNDHDDVLGFIDDDGKWLFTVTATITDVNYLETGITVFKNNKDKYYVAGPDKKVFGPYATIKQLENDMVVAESGNQTPNSPRILITGTGEETIDKVLTILNDRKGCVASVGGKKYIYLNNNPTPLGPFDNYYTSFEDVYVVQSNNVMQIITASNEKFGPFNEVKTVNEHVAVVIEQGRNYLLDLNSGTKSGPYLEVYEFSSGIAWVKIKVGALDFGGTWVAVDRLGVQVKDVESRLEYDIDGYSREVVPPGEQRFRKKGSQEPPVAFPLGFNFKNGIHIGDEIVTKSGKVLNFEYPTHVLGGVYAGEDKSSGVSEFRLFTSEVVSDNPFKDASPFGSKYIRVFAVGQTLLNLDLTVKLGPHGSISEEHEGFVAVGDYDDGLKCVVLRLVHLDTGRTLGPYLEKSVYAQFIDGVAEVQTLPQNGEPSRTIYIDTKGNEVFVSK